MSVEFSSTSSFAMEQLDRNFELERLRLDYRFSQENLRREREALQLERERSDAWHVLYDRWLAALRARPS
jgi:hypothetical protein